MLGVQRRLRGRAHGLGGVHGVVLAALQKGQEAAARKLRVELHLHVEEGLVGRRVVRLLLGDKQVLEHRQQALRRGVHYFPTAYDMVLSAGYTGRATHPHLPAP